MNEAKTVIASKTAKDLVEDIITSEIFDVRQLHFVKNLLVVDRHYELAAKVREFEKSKIAEIRQTEAFQEAHQMNVALGLLGINTDMSTSYAISELFKFTKTAPFEKFSTMDAAKIQARHESLATTLDFAKFKYATTQEKEV
jgi:hypothetical protein